MTDLEDKFCPGESLFGNNIQERACLGQSCSRILINFLSQLFVNVLNIFGCFCTIHLSKRYDESIVWLGFLCSAAGYILFSSETTKNFVSAKNRVFLSIFGRSETEKLHFFPNWLKNETFQ